MARQMARRDLGGGLVVTFSANLLANSFKFCTFAASDSLGGSVVSVCGLELASLILIYIYYYGYYS